jgi:hypothetical protein
MVVPLAAEGPGLSDILLYEPVGLAEPDSLMAAASSMLGTTELEDVRELGLYWKVYGPAAETPLMFTLRLEEEGGGRSWTRAATPWCSRWAGTARRRAWSGGASW